MVSAPRIPCRIAHTPRDWGYRGGITRGAFLNDAASDFYDVNIGDRLLAYANSGSPAVPWRSYTIVST